MPTPELVAEGLRFPEGPVFAADGVLYLSEVQGGAIVRIDVDGRLERFPVGGRPIGLAADADGRLIVCDADRNQLRRFDPARNIAEVLADAADGWAIDEPNDLAFDRDGNILFTCPGGPQVGAGGYVCVLTPAGECRRIGGRLHFPNGVALADEGSTLIVAETRRRRLWRGRWTGTEWVDPRPFASTGEVGGPDGMAVADDGRVLAAIYGAGHVGEYDRSGGRIGEIRIPGANPSNLAFDPTGRRGLMVTEAQYGRLWAFPDRGDRPQLFCAP